MGTERCSQMLRFTDETFDNHLKNNENLIVMFTAEFAGPCRLAAPVFDSVRRKCTHRIKFGDFDLDGNTHVPEKYGVKQLPLFILFKSGQPVDLLAGAVSEEYLTEWIDDRVH